MNNEELDFELEENEEGQEEQEIEQPSDEKVTLTKKQYNAINRKARAYDAAKETPEKKQPTPKTSSVTPDQFARLEMKIDGYSDAEIDFVEKYGGKPALENPHVKAAIESIRQQRKAEDAVVTSESNKSDVERKYSESELLAMPLEEMDKILRQQQ